MGTRRAWLTALALVVMTAPAADARSPRPAACPPGAFVVDAADADALAAALGADATTLTIENDTARLADCSGPAKVRAKRRATVVKAALTCGTVGPARFKGKLSAPACDLVLGSVKRKGAPRIRFEATREDPAEACGNGVLDSGEECDDDIDCSRRTRCSASCTCVSRDQEVADTTQVLIDDAYQAGTIDLATALLYRAYAIFDDPRLPAEYDGMGSDAEDIDLFTDIAAAWDAFTPEQQDALVPFVVRPSDARSVFSTAYGTTPATARPAAAATRAAAPCTTVTSCPAWQSTDGAHVRVWSCGDALAAARATVLADAEGLYGPLSAFLGEPVPDVEDNDASGPKLDIYLAEFNQARLRDGECRPITRANVGGHTVPVPQRLVTPGGVRISSGYVVIPIGTLQSGTRRSTIAHELFHVAQLAHNERAAGSWVGDATAVWAEWHFVPETAAEAVHSRFREFQAALRAPLDEPFPTTDGRYPSYDRYVWFFFAEQQGHPQVVASLWRELERPGKPTKAVDAVFPFATHFHDFILRNQNGFPLVKANLPVYRDLDDDFPFPQTPDDIAPGAVVQLGNVGTNPAVDVAVAVNVEPLASRFHRLTVAEAVRKITFDLSEVDGGDNLDVEILLRTTAETDPLLAKWERRHVTNRKLELCRDDGDPQVYEAYVVLGNHDWRGRNQITGALRVKGRPLCCPAGKTCWTGTASAQRDISTPYGTFHGSAEASVVWEAVEGDPTESAFAPRGSVTYSASAQLVGECTARLFPTSFAIGPGHGLLQFFAIPGQPPQYLGLGSSVEGTGLVDYEFTCPDKTTTLKGDAWPWFDTGGFREFIDPPGTSLTGHNTQPYGQYSWSFQRD